MVLVGGETVSVIEDMLSYVNRQIEKSYSQSSRYNENSFDCFSLGYRVFEAARVKLVHKGTGGKVEYIKDFKFVYTKSCNKKFPHVIRREFPMSVETTKIDSILHLHQQKQQKIH